MEYRDASVLCPFYVNSDDKSINCEGFISQSVHTQMKHIVELLEQFCNVFFLFGKYNPAQAKTKFFFASLVSFGAAVVKLWHGVGCGREKAVDIIKEKAKRIWKERRGGVCKKVIG